MTPAVSPIEIIDLHPIRPSHSGVDVSVSNIAFAKGRRTAVIGPNGCGKTTLLEAALGLRPDYYRHVQIFGNPVKGADRFGYSDIGFAGQRHTYTDGITAKDIIKLHNKHMRKVDDVDLFDISSFEKQNFTKLSSGQRRRILLRTALDHRPPLAILDEPEAGLDELGTEHLIGEIAKRHNDELTTIIATHTANTLASCDDIIVMEKGKIRFHSTLSDLINQEVGSTTIEISPPVDMNIDNFIKDLKISLIDAIKFTVTREKRIIISGKDDLKFAFQDGPLKGYKDLAILRSTNPRDVLFSICGDVV